jgi:processive 1,2-diacylglycerol beta-glucosyltransferase
MEKKRILLLHITPNSGHHRASLAIERALRIVAGGESEILNIDALNYTNPILARIINKTYMSVIRSRPEVWEYLYDNPRVVRNTQRLRELIHRFNSWKLKNLLDDFRPQVIVCTQAFPCGMIADYKKTYGLNIPLIGVLTDYVAHSYWLYDSVDCYIVPSDSTKNRLLNEGIPEECIKILGIPVSPEFVEKKDKKLIFQKLGLDSRLPTVLIMGGSQGLGPMSKIVSLICRIPVSFQILIVCGTNKLLYTKFRIKKRYYRKPILVLGYAENMDEIMEIADVSITKPGGLTTAEALAKGLPMIIIRPIPGQEAKNAEFLLEENVALKARDEIEVAILLKELLSNPLKLEQMRRQTLLHGRPNSAFDIANLILGLVT